MACEAAPIARRLELDVKTVRRAISQPPPAGAGVAAAAEQAGPVAGADHAVAARGAQSDPEAECWLLPWVPARTVRRYVAGLRPAVAPKEAFVHRTVRAATTVEVDFGEVVSRHRRRAAQGEVPGGDATVLHRVLREGVRGRAARVAARRHRVGVPPLRGRGGPRGPRQHLAGGQGRLGGPGPRRDRSAAFRGGYPFRAEFCAPAKGWERRSVECGVKFVSNLVFRPRLAAESWAALNAATIPEQEADLPTRRLEFVGGVGTGLSGQVKTEWNGRPSFLTSGRGAEVDPRGTTAS